MEAKRKTCFDQLRHRNVSSIDELKLRLRKLYIADLKCKRNKILNGKREIDITEEEELEFYRNFCRIHFSQYGDPWDAEEDLLSRIWEEIKVENVEGDDSDLLPELLDNYLNHETIICPVCLRLPACRVSGYLTCGCGLHFPLPANIDLQDLESLVMTCSELHNDSCQEVPVFSVRQSGLSLQFVSSCDVCQMESVILEPQPETGGVSMESE